jgi:hypothetical protein
MPVHSSPLLHRLGGTSRTCPGDGYWWFGDARKSGFLGNSARVPWAKIHRRMNLLVCRKSRWRVVRGKYSCDLGQISTSGYSWCGCFESTLLESQNSISLCQR